jgi:hypothetical protein
MLAEAVDTAYKKRKPNDQPPTLYDILEILAAEMREPDCGTDRRNNLQWVMNKLAPCAY